MAAALLTHRAGDRIVVRSGGTAPANAINPTVLDAMNEIGIDHNATHATPKLLTEEAVQVSDVVITMGCGDACPFFPGQRYEDWKLDDLGAGIREQRPGIEGGRVRDRRVARVQTCEYRRTRRARSTRAFAGVWPGHIGRWT
jgi:protein-tyrosine-phosphatase